MTRKSRAKPLSPFRCFKSSPEVMRLVVMMYVRYPLSLRNVEDLLLWLPPVMQEVRIRCASDRVRSSVRPVNAALSEAAGRYGDLRIRSKSVRRAQAAPSRSLVFLVQICSIILPIQVVAFLPPLSDVRQLFSACRSCCCLSQNSIILILRQHGPYCPRHLVGQSDRHEQPRLSRRHASQPRTFWDRSAPYPVQARHRADN